MRYPSHPAQRIVKAQMWMLRGSTPSNPRSVMIRGMYPSAATNVFETISDFIYKRTFEFDAIGQKRGWRFELTGALPDGHTALLDVTASAGQL